MQAKDERRKYRRVINRKGIMMDEGRESRIVGALLDRSTQRVTESPAAVQFTDDADANRMVSNLVDYPHAYVIACLLDFQMPAERAWAIPYTLKLRLGYFDIDGLYDTPAAEFDKAMKDPSPLHRFPNKSANVVYHAVRKIKEDYGGDASGIWVGNPSSATIVRRFSEFKNAGPKISTMATNILVRYFGVQVSDFESIDVSADVHVVRVFKRLGIVGNNATKEDVIYKARQLNPDYPGVFDAELWHLGRETCKAQVPDCETCYLRMDCRKEST